MDHRYRVSRRPPTTASAELGRRLQARRKSIKGLTQEKLAQRIDMTYSLISDIERGRANPTFNTILKLAAALDEMDAGELMCGLKPDANPTLQQVAGGPAAPVQSR